MIAANAHECDVGVIGNPAGPEGPMTPQPEAQRLRLRDGVHYLDRDFAARVRFLVIWEARQQAKQAVIRRIRAEGRQRVSLLSSGEIAALANAYLREHAAELLRAAEASGRVQRLRAEHQLQASPVLPNAAITIS